MARINSLTLMNGDKIISIRDVVTTTKNGLMTPEMYQALLEANQGSSSITVSNKIEFNTTGSQTKVFSFTFIELGISGPTIGQIVDNEGLIRDDLIISAYWTSSGLTINLTQIDDLTGTWQFIYAAPEAADGDIILLTNNNTIIPENNVVFKKTISSNDVFFIDTTSLSSLKQITFELHLIQPSTAVSFILPNTLMWPKENKFSTENQEPDMDEANTLYCIVIRWDGEDLLANLAYSKTIEVS